MTAKNQEDPSEPLCSLETQETELPSVGVVMSTYNGKQYVAEQIESILAQEGVDVELYIRDDGSTDGTRELISNKYENDGRVHFIASSNMGVKLSFFLALDLAGDHEFYAFADQDDVWLPHKLRTAVQALPRGKEEACLFTSNAIVVDEELSGIKNLYANNPLHGMKLGGYVTSNPIPGMTMVFTRELKRVMQLFSPGGVLYHDHWLILLASLLGRIIYCEDALVLYRQHGNNVVSSSFESSPIAQVRYKLAFFKNRDRYGEYPIDEVAARILNQPQVERVLSECQRNYLETVSRYREGIGAKLSLIRNPLTKRPDFIGRLTLLIRIMFELL